jgi:hypothetical protein
MNKAVHKKGFAAWFEQETKASTFENSATYNIRGL